MRYVVVVALWLLFAIACIVGFVVGVLALPFSSTYASNVFKAMDRAAAAVVGFSGDATISKACGWQIIGAKRYAEQGVDIPACRFCRVVCAVLSIVLETDHCEREARK